MMERLARPTIRRCLSVIVIILAAWAMCFGDEVDPVEAGGTALRGTRLPWYDADEDAVRVVSLKNESSADERQDWRDNKPKRPEWKWDWDWDWWDSSGNAGTGGTGNFRFPSFAEILQFLGWSLLFALLVLLVYLLVRAFLKLEQSEENPQGRRLGAVDDRTDEQRIRELPIQPVIKKGDFLSMARECYERGAYTEAIVYLFSHRLIQLDRAGFIRLTRGKTNRQYLFEITRSPRLRKILGQTIVCFEDVFFGKHDLSKDRFEQAWNDNGSFEQIIQETMAGS